MGPGCPSGLERKEGGHCPLGPREELGRDGFSGEEKEMGWPGLKAELGLQWRRRSKEGEGGEWRVGHGVGKGEGLSWATGPKGERGEREWNFSFFLFPKLFK